jgi:hypothetical protein
MRHEQGIFSARGGLENYCRAGRFGLFQRKPPMSPPYYRMRLPISSVSSFSALSAKLVFTHLGDMSMVLAVSSAETLPPDSNEHPRHHQWPLRGLARLNQWRRISASSCPVSLSRTTPLDSKL